MNILSRISRTCQVFVDEIKAMFKDQGALLFCIILPLGYPLIYSWVYNNEVVHEVPVAVVDMSHSALSRKFIQMVDAAPDTKVALQCTSIDDARNAVGHGDVYGVIYFPEDFAIKVGRHEQGYVSVYCDMSYMLTYKAIFQTATEVSQLMGAEVKREMAGNYTAQEEKISSRPLDYEAVPVFNTTGGYGNFVLPGVLVLIIQQAMLLAVGLLAGTDRERHYESVKSIGSTLFGKCGAYFAVFAVMLAYVTLVIPRVFGFVMMVHFVDWIRFMTPYLLSCVFFSTVVSDLVRYRENVMLIVVFTSLPLLFLSGLSWPQSNIPGFWQSISELVPSTFGIRGFVRMSSMGARIADVAPELRALWIQSAVYGVFAVLVTYRRYIWRERQLDI